MMSVEARFSGGLRSALLRLPNGVDCLRARGFTISGIVGGRARGGARRGDRWKCCHSPPAVARVAAPQVTACMSDARDACGASARGAWPPRAARRSKAGHRVSSSASCVMQETCSRTCSYAAGTGNSRPFLYPRADQQ